MTYEQIITDLKNKIYKPIYYLMGNEPFYIDKITNHIIKNVLTDVEKDFNQTILYGKDTDIHTVITTAKRFPMMANLQVVVVKEAQNIKNIDELLVYVENPLKSTILVINYKYKDKPPDKRKKIFKAIEKTGILFDSKKLYDNQIPKWINTYLNEKKYSIAPDAEILLSDFIGSDLNKIANELNKLIINIPENTRILPEHVEKNIGISKDYNNFELHKALGQKDILKSNRIINYFGKNQKDNHITLTILLLYIYFSKVLAYHFIKDKSNKNVASILQVNPYFVRDYQTAARNYNAKKLVEIISLLRQYDVKSKGIENISTPAGELLKEMTFRILH